MLGLVTAWCCRAVGAFPWCSIGAIGADGADGEERVASDMTLSKEILPRPWNVGNLAMVGALGIRTWHCLAPGFKYTYHTNGTVQRKLAVKRLGREEKRIFAHLQDGSR